MIARALITLALVGCSGGSMPEDIVALTVELGTGADAYEPLADGGDVLMYEGPQGGRHVYGHARVTGPLDQGSSPATEPETWFEAHAVADGRRIDAQIPPIHYPFVYADGVYTMEAGRFVVLDIAAADVVDTMIDITIFIRDQQGHTGNDTKRAVVRAAPSQ